MKIAIIGCGTIGSSMAMRWRATHQIALYDRTLAKAQHVAEVAKGTAYATATEAIADSELILLAVKPQNLHEAVELIGKHLRHEQLLASVLAGITLETLVKCFPTVQLLRVMPNIALEYGRGVIGLTDYKLNAPFTKENIQTLFDPLGWVHWVTEEKMDALSALSGSGMAFMAVIIEATVEAALAMGLSTEEGLTITLEMIAGTISTLQHTGMHPSSLKWQVASPGGTTIAGLYALEEHGLRSALMQTFLATFKRNKELGKKI
jgi:pyrroline-5-carboxylate reductase